MDFKRIAQEAVTEIVRELKTENEPAKVDKAVEVIDAVNMIEGVVQSTLKEMGIDPEQLGEEGVGEIAKNSARAAIEEGIKRLQ